MQFIFSKSMIILSLILLAFQYNSFTSIVAQADMKSEVDQKMLSDFTENQNALLSVNQKLMNLGVTSEETQNFSFDVNTFQTTMKQTTILSFKSQLPAEEVIVRIPPNGRIDHSMLNNGEMIEYSEGEYWILKTKGKQTSFELPIVFDETGNYFITIDHDADHFYLEVKEPDLEIEKTKANIDDENIMNEEDYLRPLIAKELHLNIPQSLIMEEKERILEKTRDIQNRSISTVNNWSQFRSAWNSSGTTVINLASSITFSTSILGSSLNARNSSIIVTGNYNNSLLDFLNSSNSLEMNGSANLTLRTVSLSSTNNTFPSIKHNGSGVLRFEGFSVQSSLQGPIIEGQNINISEFVRIFSSHSGSPITLVRGGTLTIASLNSERSYIGLGISGATNIKPISSDSSSKIIINANRFAMGASVNDPRSSWFSVNAVLTGVNGSQVLSSESDPNDFAARYTQLFNESWFASLNFNVSDSEMILPDIYSLSLQASPDSGGSPSATNTTLTQGSTTTLNANPNSGYRFVRWEIVSGTGSSIADSTSANTTFTMGSENATVRAVYEEITYNLTLQASPSTGGNPSAETTTLAQGSTTTLTANPNPGFRFVQWEIISGTGSSIADSTSVNTTFTMGSTNTNVQAIFEEKIQVSPVDPLDPEIEVDPENKPELPEDQKLLSIDFVSSFNFGSQAISAQDQTYYAQPQRLLNEDGTVNSNEERPNYVQISDRRPENERHGWQLAVTQRGQFEGGDDQELMGARLRLMNQQVVSAQNGAEPHLQQTNPLTLVPNAKRILLLAQGDEGTGTWVYRFGDSDTAGQSIALDVPKGATPEATRYMTTLLWELSAVPEN